MESNKKSRTPLTEDEVAIQVEYGKRYRALMTQSIKDFLVHVKDKNKVGLFLSGGVDSTTVLWALLEQGIKPYCYTFRFPTNDRLSTDAVKAKALADKYKLPFKIVDMTSDPDELAELIYKINDESIGGLGARPDFEVLPVFYTMSQYARDKDGVTDIFSGIGDSAIHLLGRKAEIEGRTGLMTPLYTDYRRVSNACQDQLIDIIKMMSGQGVRILLPLTTTAMMNPYRGLPWELMNNPRLKQVTIGAWAEEEELSGVKAVVSPLQNGDANGRGYYDTMIPRSRFAVNLVGRQINTAQVFYNSLMKLSGVPLRDERKSNIDYEHMWFRYAADGVPFDDKFYALEKKLLAQGIIKDPEQPDEEESLFGDLFDGQVTDDDEGSELPIPQGVYDISAEHHYGEIYEMFELEATRMAQYLRDCSSASAAGPREVFAAWGEKCENNFKELRQIRSN